MSKGQRGNKEAKKPKQPKKAPVPAQPLAPSGRISTDAGVVPPRGRK
jgi:hypothetical protein